MANTIECAIIAEPDSADIFKTCGKPVRTTPILAKWAHDYLQFWERFHFSGVILDGAEEFGCRQLPVDVMVQNWQYLGRYRWNAMRCDKAHYPDPSALVNTLHGTDLRPMLSVRSKAYRKSEPGQPMADKGF